MTLHEKKKMPDVEWQEERYPRQMIRNRTPLMYTKAGLRFFKYLIKREIRYYRKRPIDTLFFLTYRCTSRCKTCTLWQHKDKSDEMSLEDWKHTVDMCADLGAKNFEMFGGDALLRKDVLIPLAAYIKSKPGLCCDLVTNCTIMSEEIVKGLVDSGMDDIWISIDGVAEDHNRVRGRDRAFDKVEQTVAWFRKARGNGKFPVLHANTTISRYNHDSFDRVLPYAESVGFDFMHLEYAGEFWDEVLDQSVIDGIRPSPYFVRQGGESILVNDEQARLIKSKTAQMKKDVRRMKISLQCENIDKLTMKQMTSGFCDNRRCYITRNKITIDPRGRVLACPFFSEWILGDIREQHLRYIWNNKPHKRFMKHFAAGPMKMCDYCILGVQRNPGPLQNLRDYMNRALGRVRI